MGKGKLDERAYGFLKIEFRDYYGSEPGIWVGKECKDNTDNDCGLMTRTDTILVSVQAWPWIAGCTNAVDRT